MGSNVILSAYEQVKIARDKDRPTAQTYIKHLFDDFIEFSGDRFYGEDKAILAGIATFNNIPCTIISLEKGLDTKEKIKRNFGCAHPEGYRKALRLMKQAEKFNRPVVCFIDTAGAYCGIAAEERGQGQAIAQNLMEMMTLKVPILSILIGEGGSGGALALGVGNEVWMMENSVYSVISPEGCASILWKDPKKVDEAAKSLKLTATDLLELEVIEKIIPFGSKDNDIVVPIMDFKNNPNLFMPLRTEIDNFINHYQKLSKEELITQRYKRFRKY